jgi:hypothetical protein
VLRGASALLAMKYPGAKLTLIRLQKRTSIAPSRPPMAVNVSAGIDNGLLRARITSRNCSMAMKPTKPRVWTEDEVKLLLELAHLKRSAPVIAKQLGRYTASVRRRARQLGLLLPPSRGGPGALNARRMTMAGASREKENQRED